MTSEGSYSRVVATANALGDVAEDRNRFLKKRVLLTSDARPLSHGRECLLCALRLLVRICPNITVALPQGNETTYAAQLVARQIAFGRPVDFVEWPPSYDEFDAILNIGSTARADLPWTAVDGDGWLLRVTSGSRDLPTSSRPPNAIAALAAASFGAAEVFKRLLQVKSSRGPLLEDLAWSLFSYEVGSHNAGPPITGGLSADLLLGGAGAIGNGVIHLLSRLPLTGRVVIVDAQAFTRSNLGTCLLLGPDQVGMRKATVGVRALQAKFDAKGFCETLRDFSRRLGKSVRYPKIAIGALDNIDARHELQDLWPDVLIDGAIGPLACQVSRHPLVGNTACVRCLFQRPFGEPAEEISSRVTGLSAVRASDPSAIVNEADVGAAPAERREWLAQRVGRPVCSVVSEAITRELSEDNAERLEPSVPFVACLAASMAVAELVKTIAGLEPVLDPRFQFDVLRGPGFGQFLPQERRQDCLCVSRAHIIERWRRQRDCAALDELSSAR